MQKQCKEYGGVALEYLVISLVTLGMSFAAVKIVKGTIKVKMEELSKTMNLPPEGESSLNEILGE